MIKLEKSTFSCTTDVNASTVFGEFSVFLLQTDQHETIMVRKIDCSQAYIPIFFQIVFFRTTNPEGRRFKKLSNIIWSVNTDKTHNKHLCYMYLGFYKLISFSTVSVNLLQNELLLTGAKLLSVRNIIFDIKCWEAHKNNIL